MIGMNIIRGGVGGNLLELTADDHIIAGSRAAERRINAILITKEGELVNLVDKTIGNMWKMGAA